MKFRAQASIVAIAVAAALTACGAYPTHVRLETMSPPSPTPYRATVATPVWRYALPSGSSAGDLAIVGRILLAAGPRSVVALDRTNGRRLWQRTDIHSTQHDDDAPSSLAAGIVANAGNGVTRFDPATGRTLWNSPRLIAPSSTFFSRITTIAWISGSVFAGCNGGRIVRLDPASGVIRASTAAFSVQSVDDIRTAGADRISVFGIDELFNKLAVLRASDLGVVMAARSVSGAIGAIGNMLIFDECCFLRSDTYRPATIVTVDAIDGTLSKGVDLRPDAAYFANPDINNGARATVIGSRLFFTVGGRLYDYGDPLRLAARPVRLLPRIVQSRFGESPAFLGAGYLFAEYPARDGSIRNTIFDLRRSQPRLVWQQSSASPVGNAILRSGIALVPSRGASIAVRLRDGASIVIVQTALAASDGESFYASIAPGTPDHWSPQIVHYTFSGGTRR